jgi:hypothetical protein
MMNARMINALQRCLSSYRTDQSAKIIVTHIFLKMAKDNLKDIYKVPVG